MKKLNDIEQMKADVAELKEQFKILSERAGWDIEPGAKFEPADDKPRYTISGDYKLTVPTVYGDVEAVGNENAVLELKKHIEKRTNDTHRTVTLRIPKGMRIGEAIRQVWMEAANSGYLGSVSDTDLQKALDEVQPNE